MSRKLLFFATSFIIGWLFQLAGLPAGWLLGALMTGMFWSFFIKKLIFRSELFTLSLALVGIVIGFMVVPEEVWAYRTLLPAFLLSLFLTLVGGITLGKLFGKWTKLEGNTAFFCCLPGGASEVIALSDRYEADQRIVAAFHTARITLFVFAVPLIVGLGSDASNAAIVEAEQSFLADTGLVILAVFLAFLVFFVSRFLSFPGAPMFVAIILGFAIHQFVVPNYSMPNLVMGMAQVLIGSLIGMRFDRKTLKELKRIGGASAVTLGLYVLMSVGLALIFFLLSPLPFYTTLLAIVPAGAAEMASTAATLQLDATVVATLQMLRVLGLFLALPFLVRWFAKKPTART
ncbi:AbrB family transcriptional regulator [Shouchella sp. JSM 1781072]|uniref:AbrB family transcriptional regulator n=1 Tax=Bacillaceae TaxID=186817 RepID=UPI0020D1ED2C|nr:AbrB family transcriptional regulator [Alkalihalobacillus sp. LMS6]UTR06325.1 AbrB family transcriptional regulator [Alkalihalobacillus sp. LMS6]